MSSFIVLAHLSEALLQTRPPVCRSVLDGLLQQSLQLIQSCQLWGVVSEQETPEQVVVAGRGQQAAQISQEHVVLARSGAEGPRQSALHQTCS